MSYKGKYKPLKPEKYAGDIHNIVYRSLWERQVFRFCEANDDIVLWSSEAIVVPYRCETDGKMHRYFVDLFIRMKSGATFIIEIKPFKETMPPKAPKRKTPRYLRECLTYVKNQSKWKAADEFAKSKGWQFAVWTERELKKMGILIL